MDLLAMSLQLESILIYSLAALLCILVVSIYILKKIFAQKIRLISGYQTQIIFYK